MIVKIDLKLFNVLDKTLKGIRAMVCDSITKRFFRASAPRTKYFKQFVFVAQ